MGIHPLVCQKCGAGLDAEQEQRILTCGYCGQAHTVVRAEQGGSRRAVPATPRALRGVWIAVTLLVVVLIVGGWLFTRTMMTNSEAGPGDPDAEAAAATPAGPGDPARTYSPGDLVDVHWGNRWWKGRILSKKGALYRIHYDGWSSSWDEDVDATRLQPRDGG